MNDISEQAIKNARNIRKIDEYLTSNKVSDKILHHPRYSAILWKISYLMRNFSSQNMTTGERKFDLETCVFVEKDGSVRIHIPTKNIEQNPSSVETYFFDESAKKLKRRIIQGNSRGLIDTYISTYNENGIEEKLQVEQKDDIEESYFAEITRIKGRPNAVKVQTGKGRGNKLFHKRTEYRISNLDGAFEDILLLPDEIAPFNSEYFSQIARENKEEDESRITRILPFHRNLNQLEQNLVNSCGVSALKLNPERARELARKMKQFNYNYNRNTYYEGVIEKEIGITGIEK